MSDVYRYASPELLEWFETHQRMQLSQFAHEMTGQDRWAANASRQREANSRINRDRSDRRRTPSRRSGRRL